MNHDYLYYEITTAPMIERPGNGAKFEDFQRNK